MFAWIIKAPGLLRTISALLGSAALIADQVVQDVDLSQGFTKAALYTGAAAIIRAVTRKAIEE